MEKIALQLYSIKELTQVDFLGTLEKVAKAGYDGVEFAGFFGTPAKELKKVLDGTGLQAAGCHTGIDELMTNLDSVIEYALEINNPYVICPGLPANMRDSADAYKRTAEVFNKIGEKCAKNKIGFGYHNHDFEFLKFDDEYGDEYGLDLLVKYTQPENLFIELDTFWVKYTGLSSVDFIEKYRERCAILHIKDMKSMEEKVSTEIGKGILDFRSITSAAKKYGAKWYTVEQEEFEIPQLQSIEESIKYLRSIL